MGASIKISGINDRIDEIELTAFRSRLLTTYKNFSDKNHVLPLVTIGELDKVNQVENAADKCTLQYHHFVQKPLYDFSQLILPESTFESIVHSVQILKVEHLVFDDWGLRKIEPFPKTALNFYGPPGTGKTLAAHAIANFLNKQIIIASYAELESKYHGEGPKDIKRIFQEAEQNDAVLFLDEADSLLSKRLTNVSQGSEQAINSMRSQLLINLEQFHGVVVFATNLIQNYDKAFETRVTHIEFRLPDKNCRRKIWEQHLPDSLPIDKDIDFERLVEIEDICGRDIRNAIIQSAVNAALNNRIVSVSDLIQTIEEIKKNRYSNESSNCPVAVTESEQRAFVNAARKAIRNKRRRK